MHSCTNNSESRKRIIPNDNKSTSLLYLKVKEKTFGVYTKYKQQRSNEPMPALDDKARKARKASD